MKSLATIMANGEPREREAELRRRAIPSRSLGSRLVLIFALLLVGCGPRTPAVDRLRQQTSDILGQLAAMKLTCIDLRSELDDELAKVAAKPEQADRLNARKQVLIEILEQIQSLKESIFAHSGRKEPSLDEIRHQELDHAELKKQAESIRETLDGFRLMRQ